MERLVGEGHLYDAREPGESQRVACEIDVYRDWQLASGTLQPGEWVIEGHLLASPDVLEPLAGRGDPFRLVLDDGRVLEVFVLDGQGRIVNVEGTTFTDVGAR